MRVPHTTLAIDTSGPRLQLAVWDGESVDVLVEDLAKGHAEIIFSRIETLLSRNILSLSDVTRIAVTTGPGSFTGLRIGLSAANGLGLGLDIPVIGVPTLLAMSLDVEASAPFTITKDARRDQAYAQKFEAPGKPQGNPELVSLSTLAGANSIAVEKADSGALARFAASVAPEDFLPIPVYIRDADAKPQTKGIVAHKVEAQ